MMWVIKLIVILLFIAGSFVAGVKVGEDTTIHHIMLDCEIYRNFIHEHEGLYIYNCVRREDGRSWVK